MKYESKQYLQELTKKEQLDIMKSNFFSNNKLSIKTFENAYILPPIDDFERKSWLIGGVLDSKKQYINESGQYAVGEKNRVYGKYNFCDDDTLYLEEEVVYLNYFIPHWGHYLLDVIGRLWYVLNDDKIKILYTYKLKKELKIQNNFLELLELLGISEDRIIFVNAITRVKKVIIPETSICITDYYTNEYQNIINRIVEKALDGYKPRGDRKIYCSRTHFKKATSKEMGEEKLERVFRENGYEIIYMEDYSLVEQVRLLNDSEEIVCVSGSLVHNAMFIKNNNCKFTILNKTYKINPNVYLTNQLSAASIRFIDCYLSPLPIYTVGRGPFMLMVTDELMEYFIDNNFSLNCISRNISILEIFQYYFLYIKKNNKKITKHEKYAPSPFSKYDISSKQVRHHYLKQLIKNANHRG